MIRVLKRYRFTLLLLCVGAGIWLATPKEIVLSGDTMGTTYSVKAYVRRFTSTRGLKTAIDERLVQINRSMSTFDPESEISRFNRYSGGQPFVVSEDFFKVVHLAKKIHQWTDGAWDGTVYPLLVLWGFTSSEPLAAPPSRAEVDKVLKRTGFAKVTLESQNRLGKKNKAVQLDLSAIAKGYGVDMIAALLQSRGIHRYFVEIGGEIVVSGTLPGGRAWRIGINSPDEGPGAVIKVLYVSDKAVATSGDYRNFQEWNGKKYSHILDPRTGFPVENNIASVTIIADDCAVADGLATAVMVLGVKEGLKVLESKAGVEGLIIVRGSDGDWIEYRSEGFFEYEKGLE